MNKHIEENKILPDVQHGFRTKHSSVHQLLRVSEHIADNLNKRYHTAMALLDVQQAFDRVWHDGLIFKLIDLKFPHYLIGTIKSFLSERTIRVKVGDSLSSSKPITAGVPQGSKLSPTLFNIFGYDIPQNNGILTAIYADDIAVIRSTKLITNCTTLLNKHLIKLINWYNHWRLSINESKSVAIYFSKRNKTPHIGIKIKGHPLKWSNSAKYLGVTLGRKLTWAKHIKLTRNKAYGAYLQLKPFFNNKTISKKTKLRAFSAIIRSIQTYAIPIWGAAGENRLKPVEGSFMKMLRQTLDIPWFIRNKQILKEFKITSPNRAAPIFAAKLRESVKAHPNPTIAVSATYSSKTYDWVKRPCSILEPLTIE